MSTMMRWGVGMIRVRGVVASSSSRSISRLIPSRRGLSNSVLRFTSGDCSPLELQRAASLERSFAVVKKRVSKELMPRGPDFCLFHLKEKRLQEMVLPPQVRVGELIATCGGLVLFQDYHSGAIVFLDPSTRKYHPLPPNPAGTTHFCGFGCHKLVTLIGDHSSPGFPRHDLMIYNLCAGTWTQVPTRPHGFIPRPPLNDGFFSNNCLYYLTEPDHEVMLGFDLEQEEFFESFLPFKSDFQHAVLDGNLCLVDTTREWCDIWVTKEKKVTEDNIWSGWTRLFSISEPRSRFDLPWNSDPDSDLDDLEIISLLPMCYSPCGNKVLFSVQCKILSWYNLETEEFEDFNINGDADYNVGPAGYFGFC